MSVEMKYNNKLPSRDIYIGIGGMIGVFFTWTAGLNTWGRVSCVFGNSSGNTGNDRARLAPRSQGWSTTDTVNIRNFICVDLTLLYGAGNEPTLAQFEQVFTALYYPYNTGTLLSAGVTKVISRNSSNATIETYNIPASVQLLTGYGWSCPNHYNYVDFENKKFVQEVGSRTYTSGDENDSTVITDKTNTYYTLPTPVVTNISTDIANSVIIDVSAGGSLEFQNQHGTDYQIPVPSKVAYT